MGTSTGHDPERELERSADELEERIEKLDEHIHEAERKAEESPTTQPPDEVGDYHDTDDQQGGEDPEGAG